MSLNTVTLNLLQTAKSQLEVMIQLASSADAKSIITMGEAFSHTIGAAMTLCAMQVAAQVPVVPVPDGWPNYEVEVPEREAVAETGPEAVPEAKPQADKRVFAKLGEALPYGTKVSITSLGDKMTAAFTTEGFKVGDLPAFKSPMAFSRAHANRITEAHPKETKPGNGWDWIKVEEGEHMGKTIGQIYNGHFAH